MSPWKWLPTVPASSSFFKSIDSVTGLNNGEASRSVNLTSFILLSPRGCVSVCDSDNLSNNSSLTGECSSLLAVEMITISSFTVNISASSFLIITFVGNSYVSDVALPSGSSVSDVALPSGWSLSFKCPALNEIVTELMFSGCSWFSDDFTITFAIETVSCGICLSSRLSESSSSFTLSGSLFGSFFTRSLPFLSRSSLTVSGSFSPIRFMLCLVINFILGSVSSADSWLAEVTGTRGCPSLLAAFSSIFTRELSSDDDLSLSSRSELWTSFGSSEGGSFSPSLLSPVVIASLNS